MQVWCKRFVALSTLLGALGAAVWAHAAWSKEAKISASIHDHKYHRVVMNQAGDSCVINFKLYFVAPKEGYSSSEKGRNYYRFKARVELSEGNTVFSPQFANNKPGRRVFRWSEDTTDDGCWAEKPHKLFNVDVEGCRNRNCKVRPFE